MQRRLTVYYDEDSYSIDSVLSVKLGGPVVGDWCAALEPKARAKPVTMLAVRLDIQRFVEDVWSDPRGAGRVEVDAAAHPSHLARVASLPRRRRRVNHFQYVALGLQPRKS